MFIIHIRMNIINGRILHVCYIYPWGYKESFNLHSFEHAGSKACDKLVLLAFYLSFFDK